MTLPADLHSESSLSSDVTLFDSIVVAVNGTALSEHALGPAHTLARRAELPMVLASVTRGGQPDALDERYHQSLEQHLSDVEVRSVIVDIPGSVDDALRRVSARGLLVVGMDDQGVFGSVFHNGVGESTLKHAHHLPLIVGPRAAIPPGADRVLICVDGSTGAEAMLDEAIRVARQLRLQPFVVQVNAPGAVPEEFRRDVSEEGYVRNVSAKLTAQGFEAPWEVLHGNVVDELCRAADDPQVGAVAVVSHARSSLGRLIHGSVTHQLIHRCLRPILVKVDEQATTSEGTR